ENDSSDLNENKDNISKFPLLSRNDYTINCFSELNNPTKINDNVKLPHFPERYKSELVRREYLCFGKGAGCDQGENALHRRPGSSFCTDIQCG
ncbi:MAG: hypothetical protein IKM82_03560, partial [Oscillospiraceae bacterium]|nr:hypothetical protein [Oscillospiraceae bacterium]